MLRRHEPYVFLPAPFGIALCGFLFCGWNLWSAETIPCVSTGCALFHDFTLAGVSLWWGGLAGFAALVFCALAGRPALGRILATCGLILDGLLLLLMLAAAPCLPCLLTGLLLALTYLAFPPLDASRRLPRKERTLPLLFIAWACLFVINLGALAREQLRPWPLVTAQNAQTEQNGQDSLIKVYFSPSCSACRQLVRELPPSQAARVTWLPVAEKSQDLRVIGALAARLRNGETLAQALPLAIESPMEGAWTLLQPDMLLLQVRLWRNSAHVMENGGILPLVEFSGIPSFMLPQKQSSARPASPSSGHDASMPVELGVTGGCGPQTAHGTTSGTTSGAGDATCQ